MGCDLPARDTILEACFTTFEQSLAVAHTQAAQCGEAVAVDAASISLTDGGDTCWVHPDGTLGREYSRIEGYAACFRQAAEPPEPDVHRPVAPEALW